LTIFLIFRGETKTWYGVPAVDADKFEAAMQEAVPELFETNPDLLFHLTTMLSPKVLVEKGVSVYALDQRPGEFVITFPRAYHAGFNHGFNFAEAVNFALPDWLPFGFDCVERYQIYKKMPVFSHDELVISTIKKDVPADAAIWLKKELELIMQRTLKIRKKVTQDFPPDQIQVVELGTNDDSAKQCFECHAFCFLNAFSCQCSPKKISCNLHFQQLCSCESKRLIMQIRYNEDQFEMLRKHVSKMAAKPSEWKQKLLDLTSKNKRPALKELNQLFMETENMSKLDKEVVDLKVFLDTANQWVEIANRVFTKKKGRKSEAAQSYSGAAQFFGPEKTLQHIKDLLSSAYRMGFDSPEIQVLEDMVKKAAEFQAQLHAVIKSPNPSIFQLKEVLRNGMQLEIGMDELIFLQERIEKCQWEIDSTSFVTQGAGDIKFIFDMLKKGSEYGYNENHPVMASLTKLKNEAELWKDEAINLLKSKDVRAVTLSEIETLLLKGKNIPVFKPIMGQIEKLYGSVKEWSDRANTFFAKDEDGQFILNTEKPAPFASVKRLVEDAKKLPISMQLPSIADAVKATEAWLVKGKRALGKANSARTFAMMLIDLIANVDSCTSYVHRDDVYCVCRKMDTDDSLMVTLIFLTFRLNVMTVINGII
jgi:histone demethylase JARID1